MGFLLDTQATRSNLLSVDTTLDENIDATQNYIPVASTANFSTSVVAEVETTNEVVSFSDISSNLFKYSQEFSNGVWTKANSTITTDNTTAPDGTITADKLTQNPGQTVGGLSNLRTVTSATNGVTYTISISAKISENRNYLGVNDHLSSNSFLKTWFNLSDGTVGTTDGNHTASISNEGNGWYRCSISVTSSVTNTDGLVMFVPAETDGTFTVTGNGGSIFIWGAQLEADGILSTYLPTTSTALVGLTGVTRGVNGTTAASATSGDSIQQLPYALLNVDMPVRLQGLSVSSDGTGAGRLTLCDNNGDTLCDVDIPDTKIFDLDLGGGIVFPNGIFISNSDNITAYTLFTDEYSGTQ